MLENFLSLSNSPEQMRFFFRLIHQSSWRSLILSLGCYFPPLLYGGFIQDPAYPKRLPVLSMLKNSLKECSTPARDGLGILLPAFLFSSSVKENVSWYLFPDHRRSYFDSLLFSSICRGGDS